MYHICICTVDVSVPVDRKLNGKPRRGAENNRTGLGVSATGAWILRWESDGEGMQMKGRDPCRDKWTQK